MTRRISEKTRDSLLKMNGDERRDERCMIMKRLVAEAKKLTSKQDKVIDALRTKIKALEKEITVVVGEKNDLIIKHRMKGVVSRINYTNGCEIEEQHPDLLKFDAESNKQRKEILLM